MAARRTKKPKPIRVGDRYGNWYVSEIITCVGGDQFAAVKKGDLVDGFAFSNYIVNHGPEYAVTGEWGDWRVRKVERASLRSVFGEKARTVFQLSTQAYRGLYGAEIAGLIAQL
jgi:hypothetical protein